MKTLKFWIWIAAIIIVFCGAICVAYNNAPRSVLKSSYYKLSDGGITISMDSARQFRLELIDSINNHRDVIWVTFDDVQRTTSENAIRDMEQRFNTYLVDSQYVYRGTAMHDGYDHRVALIITAQPLENFTQGRSKIAKGRGSIINCIYIETHKAHIRESNWSDPLYINL